MNKQTIITAFPTFRRLLVAFLLALIVMTGQAQEAIWSSIVMGYANAPIVKVNRVDDCWSR